MRKLQRKNLKLTQSSFIRFKESMKVQGKQQVVMQKLQENYPEDLAKIINEAS